jgi:hypothetical protein
MKLTSFQGTIQTELFQEIMYHEQLGIITFSYGYVYEEDKGQGPTYIIQLPMTFKNRYICRMIFQKYLRCRNEGRQTMSLFGYDFSWPWEAYHRIIEHKSMKLETL